MSTRFEIGRGDVKKKVNGKTVVGGWCYDFKLFGQRHHLRRGFDRQSDSEDAERELRRRLKLERLGVAVAPLEVTSPRFSNWAGVYKHWVMAQAALGEIKAPDAIINNIHSVLRFFGARPTKPDAFIYEDAPYHDLTLGDVIADPSWLRRFDDWLAEQGFAGSTRNHYNGTLSKMYWLGMLPEYRDQAGILPYNPFRDRPRYRWKRRTSTLTAADVERWIGQASYHTRLALSIATLNSKFRLANVLKLEWADVNFELKLIKVWDHKTDSAGEALVAAMPDQLVRILQDARLRHPNATHVILYHGRPVKSIDESVKNAAIAAGLVWGRKVKGGVTFHSLRHFASTQMARLQIPADQRQNVTGHKDLKMEMWYTHLFPEDERQHAEALSQTVQLEQAVTTGPVRITRPAGLRMRRKAKAAATASPGVLRKLGGLSDVGGAVGGPLKQSEGILGSNRALRGLRRGPQGSAAERRKLLTLK